MSLGRLSFFLRIAEVVFALTLTLTGSASAASHYKVLHAFGKSNDGGGLWGSLAFDPQGNLYGTTSGGGVYGHGTVFQLKQDPNGNWAESLLHSFHNNDPDGDEPSSTLILDQAGTLYGTTPVGGGPDTYGTVFKMKSGSNGWNLTVIHRFGLHDRAGCCPYGGVLMDQAGNLYGAGYSAFELSPGAHGWTETVLHRFTGQHGDGSGPYASVLMDTAGNLYGTTEHGGNERCGGGCGTAYQLMPIAGGKWKELILHEFGAIGDGAFPGVGALVLDGVGSLYGTTTVGGATGNGTVFRLTPQSNGRWKETLLHSFAGFANGQEPGAGVVIDKSGNLYGTTISGGTASCGCGVIYKLAPGPRDKWTYTVLYRFTGFEGAQPDANLILDGKGNLYGTTATGGSGGAGVVFEITP